MAPALGGSLPPELPHHKVAMYIFRVGRIFVKLTGTGYASGSGREFDPNFMTDLARVAERRILAVDPGPAARTVRALTTSVVRTLNKGRLAFRRAVRSTLRKAG